MWRRTLTGVAVLSLLALTLVPPGAAGPVSAPLPDLAAIGHFPTNGTKGIFVISSVYPRPNSTISTTLPNIKVTYYDTLENIPYSGVDLVVNSQDVTGFTGVTITPGSINYSVSGLFPLHEGLNNVTLSLTDEAHNNFTYRWRFTVNTTIPPAPPAPPIRFQTLLLYMGVAAAIAAAGFGAWILYLKQTTRFAFRKYFITHPVQRSYLILYVPAAAAFVFLLVGLDWVSSTPNLPPMALDYVLVAAIFIGLLAFAIDARRELSATRAYERAFAQFLFEMADAMRGGLDPAKAIVELSKTSSNIMRRHLRIAADAIRIGRAFETVLRDMVKPIPSPLIRRYAGLIADASGVGGETSLVVYRAAKDMDDFVKIEEERENELTLPVAVIYIAFAVLMAVLFALLYIAPTLGSLNIGFLGGGGNPLASTGTTNASAVPRLTVSGLHDRFYQLMLINALGTGAIIGAFTEGKARYGLLHSLGLALVTTIAFTILIS
ncbi:MAG: type II secretion system F family protein [Thermoplasmata archaeon]